MKSFKHLKLLGEYRCSRKALRHYALYRSCGIGDSSLNALISFHVYESSGKLPDGINSFTEFSKTNRYAHGKWILKLTHDQIIQDIKAGNVTKSEFYTSEKLTEIFGFNVEVPYQHSNWFWSNSLDTIPASTLFTNKETS